MSQSLLWIGAGDLAQRCLNYLDPTTWHTTALKRNKTTSAFNQIRYADVTLSETLTDLPPATHIVYSATPAGRTKENYASVYELGLTNLLKHINLANLERFVFISSTAVYGADPVPQDEHSLLKPPAFNGIALVQAEQFLRDQLGDKLVVIRFSGIYGPQRSQRLFDQFQHDQITINPSLDNYANRIHEEDAARVCAYVLQQSSPAPCYLGTDSTPLPLRQLYTHLAKLLQVNAPSFNAKKPYISKHFSNQLLLTSGFTFLYPNTLAGYSALLEQN